jgi:uncharacterized protein (UPF0248 family)
MIPIHELLNRIRWDKEFSKGRFEIGYSDHLRDETVRVSFREMLFEEGNHFSFQVVSDEGDVLTIPFHRIREVYKDGSLIWQRNL